MTSARRQPEPHEFALHSPWMRRLACALVGEGAAGDVVQEAWLRVEAAGYRDALAGPFAPEEFPEPLVVTLERVPALVGVVLLPDGAPAAGARVGLHRGRGAPFRVSAEIEIVAGPNDWACDLETATLEDHVDPARIPADAHELARLRVQLDGTTAEVELELELAPGERRALEVR